jgi:hypothetical protein
MVENDAKNVGILDELYYVADSSDLENICFENSLYYAKSE